MYEVRVLVSTLDDASKLLKVLEERGYSQVSMGQPSVNAQVPTGALLDRAKSSLNKLNDWIVIALYRAGAVDKAHATTSNKVVSVLQILPDARELIGTRGEGVVSRTVSMVASAVVGDKMALAAYEKTQPRKFWLTSEGVKKARLLLGEDRA